MRITAIDRLRGITIILMVFFTLILLLCRNVPALLKHNVENTLSFGDFILPLFLFASGMSLVFFAEKNKTQLFLTFCKRIAFFLLIWVFLSPFSAGQFLRMDELLLSILLSGMTILVIHYQTPILLLLGAAPMLVYCGFSLSGHPLLFHGGYLGGYLVVPFYLPIMLAGIIAGKNIAALHKLILPSALISLLLLPLVPPYKLIASPSFMMLSITFALISVWGIQYMPPCPPIERIGQKPLRYWLLMWALIISALITYPHFIGAVFTLTLSWPVASLLCIACMLLLYGVSRGIDSAAQHWGRRASQGMR